MSQASQTQTGNCRAMIFSAPKAFGVNASRLHDSLLTSRMRSAANPSETPMAGLAVRQRGHSLLAPFTLVRVLMVCAFGSYAHLIKEGDAWKISKVK
jgi:hypothetical protein